MCIGKLSNEVSFKVINYVFDITAAVGITKATSRVLKEEHHEGRIEWNICV